MSDLKIGDEIFVSDKDNIETRQRVKRIFIKHGKNNGVLCVVDGNKAQYEKGERFYTWWWAYWKRISPKKYIPFTWEDREKLKGRWVKKKGDRKSEKIINNVNGSGVIIGLQFILYDELLKDWLFDDGSPIGKEVEDGN